jgi:hypothetical protein
MSAVLLHHELGVCVCVCVRARNILAKWIRYKRAAGFALLVCCVRCRVLFLITRRLVGGIVFIAHRLPLIVQRCDERRRILQQERIEREEAIQLLSTYRYRAALHVSALPCSMDQWTCTDVPASGGAKILLLRCRTSSTGRRCSLRRMTRLNSRTTTLEQNYVGSTKQRASQSASQSASERERTHARTYVCMCRSACFGRYLEWIQCARDDGTHTMACQRQRIGGLNNIGKPEAAGIEDGLAHTVEHDVLLWLCWNGRVWRQWVAFNVCQRPIEHCFDDRAHDVGWHVASTRKEASGIRQRGLACGSVLRAFDSSLEQVADVLRRERQIEVADVE